MSIPVELSDLAVNVAERPYAYLLTVSDDGRPHAVAVTPSWDGGSLVTEVGRRSASNAGHRGSISLIWPPVEVGGYSLIVDGDATVDGSVVRIAPTKAVLHRPAPGAEPTTGGCVADCVPILK